MKTSLKLIYKQCVLERPAITLFITLLFAAFLGIFISEFKLDATSDSLVLENDEDLRYYRSIRARYGSDDYLIITYTPYSDLFSQEILDDIKTLKVELEQITRVESVTSILDVPLINSPKISLSQLQETIPTLTSPGMDVTLAKKEFRESPLYSNHLVSQDGKTTALQVIFKHDETYQNLREKRDSLREKRLLKTLTVQENRELDEVSSQFKYYSDALLDQEQADIAAIRKALHNHRNKAEMHLGGIPMIVSDIIDYIRHDIRVFGLGVLCFLVILLTVFFRKPRWVILPMIICSIAALSMIGILGLMEWRVTVVSSNFISLLLIITLSLTVHLIVRYQELHSTNPEIQQKLILWETLRSKAQPAFFTAITTMVAFGSLLVSGIRPVIDFGWMMVFGVALAFIFSFLIFPTTLMFLTPGQPRSQRDFTGAITTFFANLIHRNGNVVLIAYVFLMILSVIGITSLTVENRFIDYFKESTEIHQGMVKLDRELGGTTPLDVILEPDQSYYEYINELADEDLFDDESAGISGTSHWFNVFQLETVEQIHQHLEQLPETGKVLSIATTMKLLTQINNDEPLDNISLAVMHKRLPESIKQTLFDPYMSDDGNQLRFAIRVFESDVMLQRQALIDKIRADLSEKFGLEKKQINLTGMLVLYNNMLQSLFQSQILTIGVVFLAIMLMFMVLFRSVKIAAIAIIPNIVAAAFVLGLMGWLDIHLDIMTITIAAITIGIAVDDTIHYIHRFMEEYPKDHDYWATVNRCHASIGKAALVADLTLLPLLLVKFKPLK
jgi:predicted RND superfamily exporter protein